MCRWDLVRIYGRRDGAGTQCQFGQQQAVGPSDWDAARMKPTEGAAGAGENVTMALEVAESGRVRVL